MRRGSGAGETVVGTRVCVVRGWLVEWRTVCLNVLAGAFSVMARCVHAGACGRCVGAFSLVGFGYLSGAGCHSLLCVVCVPVGIGSVCVNAVASPPLLAVDVAWLQESRCVCLPVQILP